jgi:hypothetical protein
MIGPILCAVARAAAPTLAQVFVREAVRAGAMAAGTMAVCGAARVIRDRYERHQCTALPQAYPQIQNARWTNERS